MIGALAVSAVLAACPAEAPAAMRLDGVPPVLVSGRSYTAALVPTGVGEAVGRGWTLGVYDRVGRGWSADLPSLGFRQAFSVGLTGAPYAVSGTYSENVGGVVCTRVLSVSAGIERRVFAVSCRRAVVEPRTLRVELGRGRGARCGRRACAALPAGGVRVGRGLHLHAGARGWAPVRDRLPDRGLIVRISARVSVRNVRWN